MIISGGMNVYPAEIEAALEQHPGIFDVAVFGIPSAEWGEQVHATVVRSPGASLSEADVIAHAHEHLAGSNAPGRCPSWPNSPAPARASCSSANCGRPSRQARPARSADPGRAGAEPRAGLAEREREALDAGIRGGDLDGPVGDRAVLADQLVEPLLPEDPGAGLVHVDAARGARRLPVQADPERDAGPGLAGPITRFTSRAWNRQVIWPPAVFSVAACSANVQSPDSAHSLSISRAGAV